MADKLKNLGLALNPTENVRHNGAQFDTFTEPPELMRQERAKISFPVREVTYYLDGSKENTKRVEEIMLSIERDPLFWNDDWYDLTKDQIRELALKRVAVLSNFLREERETEAPLRMAITGIADTSTTTRTGVHFGLFLNTVRGQGTSDQLGYWMGKGAGTLKRFFGCFCMTEMGHGSNVAGLETTATFDQQMDQFIIHTPHVAATKWWIGGAAHTATHTVVFARLIVHGKDYGVKSFVVPLRSVEDHSLLPGIAIGDIGKKMGRDGIDNGWVQFTNVRIPRQYMLMKHTKVNAEGEVTMPPLAQLTYGALISGRVMMVSDSYHVAKRFLTIAIRYAAVRRQFSSTPGEPETLLLDYNYHQRRLIPRLAYTYAMQAASHVLNKMYVKATAKLSTVDTSDKAALSDAIEDLKELFSVSAGAKASCTWATAEIIDQCRQACGGHGYSGYNGFGQAFNDWVVQCTWEGDNNVLMLSAGRSLIQSGLASRKGNRVGSPVAYLMRAKELQNVKLGSNSLEDPKVLVEAWEATACRAINSAVDLYLELTSKKGLSLAQAMEELSQQRFEIARIHTRLYLIRSFFDSLENAASSIKLVLQNVAVLFALWSIETDGAKFLTSDFLKPKDLERVTELVNVYNSKVRDQAIGLTDAFNLSDYFINAPIGSYDGNVYKHYFDKVVRRNPNRDGHPPYYEKLLRPYFNRVEAEEDDMSELEEEQ